MAIHSGTSCQTGLRIEGWWGWAVKPARAVFGVGSQMPCSAPKDSGDGDVRLR